ncbi:tRNA binding protein, putative [Plasmodium knowlesi strain H]|uniref:tRNA binding protein, putative n=3 Tax=Plasmodium knowlesi TaxID=5850 RepID=A0A5K1UXS4_PLAKH|nr:tRNA import protein tRIP, putative [Plasmodium knowlesi strain H]OTN65523.1 putative Methionine--tRNA ligase [Plasmodium knowlesi]CAA9989727.1 tRNA import protein tRIP, putative [Plasmodium knowlesi strain H]SBO22881.1 tRNA binding protein, putative [Plasmodium knowlesi strain H]SBO23020.1 tRNA binding protein, putative [Plasmodium knowlesi strain H]VVS79201.1 tRNA import protein tRIP, putative [Plasmodium knowlesi strain H]|eukprot:XP_002260450.1 methionine--tRNA ligase, putative [Plasmodium knowlesi strain H]
MCVLTLVQDDVKSDILKLVLDFIKAVVIKDNEKVAFPEVRHEKKISFEYKEKQYKELFCTLYAIIDIYNCYNELFNEDEGKVSENEEFIFHLASDKFTLKQLDMKHLNDLLCEKSYIVSNRHASIVDIFYFCSVYKLLSEMPPKERVEFSHIYRWFLHIQETLVGNFTTLKKLEVRDSLETFLNSKNVVNPSERANNAGAGQQKDDKNVKNANGENAENGQNGQNVQNVQNEKSKKKNNAQNKNNQKKKVEEPKSLDDITRLNIIVGYVEEVEIHPDADTLYCLKINVGEEKSRDICSGLRLKKNSEDLLHKYVLVLANLKEKSLRGRKSHGMVLCASFGEQIELLAPPSGVKVGERIICENMDVNKLPDKTLSSDKDKNPFFHIQPHLLVKNGVAYYKDTKWLSSKGEIICPLEEGTIS